MVKVGKSRHKKQRGQVTFGGFVTENRPEHSVEFLRSRCCEEVVGYVELFCCLQSFSGIRNNKAEKLKVLLPIHATSENARPQNIRHALVYPRPRKIHIL